MPDKPESDAQPIKALKHRTALHVILSNIMEEEFLQLHGLKFIDDDDEEVEEIEAQHGKLVLQRWFYALVGLMTMISILLLTGKQIQYFPGDQNVLPIYLLLLLHSAFFLLSMLVTAFYCRLSPPSFLDDTDSLL